MSAPQQPPPEQQPDAGRSIQPTPVPAPEQDEADSLLPIIAMIVAAYIGWRAATNRSEKTRAELLEPLAVRNTAGYALAQSAQRILAWQRRSNGRAGDELLPYAAQGVEAAVRAGVEVIEDTIVDWDDDDRMDQENARARAVAALARAVARTVTNAAMESAAQSAGWANKTWLTQQDGRVRSTHRTMQGQKVPLGSKFTTGAGIKIDYPGDPTVKGDEWLGCFPAGTLVAGVLRGGTKRMYSGYLVEVRTRDGQQLSGTPNHPVLTCHGWVALGDLQEEDHLIRHEGDVDTSVGHDVHRGPAEISEVFDSLAVSRGTMWIPGDRVNFHGQRGQCDVEVVLGDRQLGRRSKFSADQFVRQCLLPASDPSAVSLERYSSLFHRTELECRSARGVVRSLGVGQSLFRGQLGHAEEHGARTVAGGDTLLRQEPMQSGSTDTKIPSQRLLGLAGTVTLDDVVGVKRYPWRGHVYNLSTVTGAYVSNGIVVHNCRCWIVIERQ